MNTFPSAKKQRVIPAGFGYGRPPPRVAVVQQQQPLRTPKSVKDTLAVLEPNEALRDVMATMREHNRLSHGTYPSLRDRSRKENTLRAYFKHYSDLFSFLQRLGDLESMLILLDRAPKNAPPVNPDSLVLYCQSKRAEAGVPVKLMAGSGTEEDDDPEMTEPDPWDDDDVVRYDDGTTVTGEGLWNSPSNEDQFMAAMTKLHQYRGHDGPYHEACAECGREQAPIGCHHHRYHPMLSRRGNPTRSEVVQRFKEALDMATAGYIAAGCSAMTPAVLGRMIETLVSCNRAWELMLATLVLVAVSLFLREDEVTGLQYEDIQWDMSLQNADGSVEYVVVRVQGKTDKHPAILVLYRNRRCPQLCPVTLLVWWLSMSGIRSGYLFPPFARFQHMGRWAPACNAVEERVSRTTVHDALRRVLGQVAGTGNKWGTHTCRKTGFLIATFGGATEADLLHAARLKSVQTLAMYRRDAKTLLDVARAAKQDGGRLVDEWRSQILLNREGGQRLVVEGQGCDADKAVAEFMGRFRDARQPRRLGATYTLLGDTTGQRARLVENWRNVRATMQQADDDDETILAASGALKDTLVSLLNSIETLESMESV